MDDMAELRALRADRRRASRRMRSGACALLVVGTVAITLDLMYLNNPTEWLAVGIWIGAALSVIGVAAIIPLWIKFQRAERRYVTAFARWFNSQH